MSNKEEPKQCETKLCCKATANLQKSVASDLEQDDKSLEELLNDDNQRPISESESSEAAEE